MDNNKISWLGYDENNNLCMFVNDGKSTKKESTWLENIENELKKEFQHVNITQEYLTESELKEKVHQELEEEKKHFINQYHPFKNLRGQSLGKEESSNGE